MATIFCQRQPACAMQTQKLPATVHGCVPVHASSALYSTDDRVCFLCGAGPDGTGGGTANTDPAPY